MITIAPSILARDADTFIQRVQALRDHVSLAQLDVINNTLIPGETFSDPALIKSLKTSLKFEIHLMVDLAGYDLAQWNHSWTESIIVHCESARHPEALQTIRSWNKKAFLAINPDTPIDKLDAAFSLYDGVLFMTVIPGDMGKAFRPDALDRVKQFHAKYPQCTIEIDGGVNATNLQQLLTAGASRFAVGSFIDSDHVVERYNELLAVASSAGMNA